MLTPRIRPFSQLGPLVLRPPLHLSLRSPAPRRPRLLLLPSWITSVSDPRRLFCFGHVQSSVLLFGPLLASPMSMCSGLPALSASFPSSGLRRFISNHFNQATAMLPPGLVFPISLLVSLCVSLRAQFGFTGFPSFFYFCPLFCPSDFYSFALARLAHRPITAPCYLLFIFGLWSGLLMAPSPHFGLGFCLLLICTSLSSEVS